PDPASFTPRARAFCLVAVSVRLSLRATTVVFVFSRTSVFSIRTSSFDHGRGLLVIFAIAVSSVSHKGARTLALAPRPARLASGCPSLHVCNRKNQTIGPPRATIIAASFATSIAELPTEGLTDISKPFWHHVLPLFAGRPRDLAGLP